MKVKTYVRVARTEIRSRGKVAVNTTRNDTALTDTRGDALPTVMFAVEFDIPDAAFDRAAQTIATIKVTNPEIAATVKQVKEQ